MTYEIFTSMHLYTLRLTIHYENYVRIADFTAVTMKSAVFWAIKTQFVPHRKHYIAATEPNRLILCKILGFHSGDYEEFRLLEYKTPVRTSLETQYFSATEPSRLKQCKI
jgi:hypothetical protein